MMKPTKQTFPKRHSLFYQRRLHGLFLVALSYICACSLETVASQADDYDYKHEPRQVPERRTMTNREYHPHVELVRGCMEGFLLNASAHSKRNETPTQNLQYRPSSLCEMVEIEPPVNGNNDRGDTLSQRERTLIYQLATCAAYVGQQDPHLRLIDSRNYPEATRWRGILSEASIAGVWSGSFPEGDGMHAEERKFGEDSDNPEADNGGNRVVFLNEFFPEILPDLYWKLRDVGERAVKSAGRDAFPDRQSDFSKLGVRCVEFLEYNAGSVANSDLGWHVDGESLYTMVIQLSQRGVDYVGGKFNIAKGRDADMGDIAEGEENWLTLNPPIGSGIIFNSDVLHGVSSIESGQRRVLVLEFWELADGTADDRRPDYEVAEENGIPNFPEAIPEGCDTELKGVFQQSCW